MKKCSGRRPKERFCYFYFTRHINQDLHLMSRELIIIHYFCKSLSTKSEKVKLRK